MRLLAVLALVGVTTCAAAAELSQLADAHTLDSKALHDFARRGKTTTPTCKNGFSLNTAKTACVCRAGKVTNVDKSKCLDNCTSGSYKVGDGTCAKCPAPFAKCSSRTVPTGCVDGYFLSAATCVKTCPAGTWGDDAPTKNRCRPCDDKHASSCSKGGATAIACSSGYLYKGKCVTLAQVPDGYYADSKTHKAEKCDAEVATCKCRGSGCALTCAKNKKNDQYLLTPKGQCKMHCPSGYYGNKKLGLCLPCDSTELTCDADGAITCAKDSAGTQLILTQTRKCVLPWMCPTGTYPDEKSNRCLPCQDGVTSCTGGDDCDATSCGKTNNGTPLYLSTRQECGIQKRRRSVADQQITAGKCITAEACVTTRWYANTRTSTCDRCDANELLCTSAGPGGATLCDSNYYLTASDDCVTREGCEALGAYFADESVYPNACHACDAGEATCTSNGPGSAMSCAKDQDGNQLFLDEGECIVSTACPVGTFPNEDDNTCASCADRFGDSRVASCTAQKPTSCADSFLYGASTDSNGEQLYLTDAGTCIPRSSCSGEYYPDDSAAFCAPCAEFGFNIATGYLFDERLGAYSNFCPTHSDGGNTPGSYVDGSTCKSCGDATQIDSCDASGAITCRAPFVKVGNSCISAATCVAIGETIYTGYVPSGRGYDIGYCWHCAEGEERNADKTGCVSQPRGT
ncbi:hypothetical protein JCM10449v2_003171 [Rhodotorula kratochvilovae]